MQFPFSFSPERASLKDGSVTQRPFRKQTITLSINNLVQRSSWNEITRRKTMGPRQPLRRHNNFHPSTTVSSITYPSPTYIQVHCASVLQTSCKALLRKLVMTPTLCCSPWGKETLTIHQICMTKAMRPEFSRRKEGKELHWGHPIPKAYLKQSFQI